MAPSQPSGFPMALYSGIPDLLYREPPPGGRYPGLDLTVAYGVAFQVRMPKRRYTAPQPDDETAESFE